MNRDELRERLIVSALAGAAHQIPSMGGAPGYPLEVNATICRVTAEKAVLLADMVIDEMSEETRDARSEKGEPDNRKVPGRLLHDFALFHGITGLRWADMSEDQKRKWDEVARRFGMVKR